MEDQASNETIIKVDNLSKTFKLPHEKHTSIKSAAISFYHHRKGYELQQALDNISFEIKRGEFFGIVGRNGSGKSTLLKVLAGIYTPSSGTISVNASLTPFIELGVGFNMELTGRENVYLNGSLLGFSRQEMRVKYKAIVDFAELGRFMDQKLKNYSGMQVRLAFSIAIQAKNDILLLDEVLAVGDEAFQKKCIDVFEKYKANKQTIILVTHDMETVRRFCNRAMLINDGKVDYIGDPHHAAQAYSKLNDEITERGVDAVNQKLRSKIRLKVMKQAGKTTSSFSSGETMTVELSWPKNSGDVKNVGVAIVKNSGEYIFGPNTFGEELKLKNRKVTFKVKLDLSQGTYHLMAGLFGNNEKEVFEFEERALDFLVKKQAADTSQGIVKFKHEWIS